VHFHHSPPKPVLSIRCYIEGMRYPEHLIGIMRQDLTNHGIVETRTPEEVDALLAPGKGTVMMVVNSVCGCAAGKARPGIVRALADSPVKPDVAATVFAGGDVEAVARVREHLAPLPPSSPSVAIFKDGKPVYMMHRHQIESRDMFLIAEELKNAFTQHCAK
jgi:putative YphP/YqiW family bacilliredoxin